MDFLLHNPDLAFSLLLLVGAFFIGGIVEKNHFASLGAREQNGLAVPMVSVGRKQAASLDAGRTEIVMGSAVIGADYFKYFLSGLVSFFGGNIAALESVLDRARREAVLRMQEQARGANYIVNVRYETTVLSDSVQNQVPKVEVLAYGTAVYLNAH